MPMQFRIKRSSQPGGVPNALAPGELAYNFADRRLYIGGPNGEIHQVGAEGQIVVDAAPSQPELPIQHAPPPTPDPGYTAGGIRRRLLPFEG